MAGFWLGPAGSMVQLPQPQPGIEASRARRGAVHELAGGGAVVDVTGRARAYRLTWSFLTADELAVLERLASLPGPYRLIDSNRRNYLTANQASGTDALADATGHVRRTQGTVNSSTAQARSGSRSLNWDTGGALGATNRGVVYATSDAAASIDATWTAVLPSTVYCFSVYARADAAISMYAGIEWYDAGGVIIGSAKFGTGTALSTTDWSTRLTTGSKTSPSNAAYALPLAFNSATTAANRDVYLDDAQFEQAAAATAAVVGTGTPVVAVDQLSDAYPLADYYSPELQLIELS